MRWKMSGSALSINASPGGEHDRFARRSASLPQGHKAIERHPSINPVTGASHAIWSRSARARREGRWTSIAIKTAYRRARAHGRGKASLMRLALACDAQKIWAAANAAGSIFPSVALSPADTANAARISYREIRNILHIRIIRSLIIRRAYYNVKTH